jgi:hypothetical protein
MCANYDPSKEIDFEAFSEFPKPDFDYPGETYKDYAAPIPRLKRASANGRRRRTSSRLWPCLYSSSLGRAQSRHFCEKAAEREMSGKR